MWLQVLRITARKTQREGKITATICLGGKERAGEFSVYGWSIDILIHDLSLSLCLLNALAMHSRAVPILFLNQI